MELQVRRVSVVKCLFNSNDSQLIMIPVMPSGAGAEVSKKKLL